MSPIPIDILLTDIHTLRPVLGPLSGLSTDRAPQPEQLAASTLAVPGNSSDLVLERWGVVVPESAAGEKMLTWIRPLLELRKEQCGLGSSDEVPLLRVAPGLDRQGARSWRTEYERIPPDSRPGYLLILGDLHEVSHDLQQELMVCASVGRLCFTTPDGQPDREGYESYCEKVRDVEGTLDDWNHRARLLFYASHDGTFALRDGYLDLIRSCYQDAKHDTALAVEGLYLFGRIDDHQWHTSETDTAGQERTLLHAAEMREPAVLLSVTHGLGVKDAAEQAERQGSLVLREAGGRRRREILGPEYFSRPFLPRGFWFLHACFGAGTPATSAYQYWLEVLHRSNLQGEDPREALRYLARDKSRPFIARVPQVALANPDGPLGILGHLDLAWTYGFQGADEAAPSQVYAEHDPYYGVLRMVALGERFGPAVASLGEKTLALGTHLATLYGDAEARGVADDEHRTLRARLWMRYLDLASYILLGDPAARLPTTAARAAAGRGVAPPVSGPSARLMQEAVMEVLRQKKPPRQIAADAGVRPATLDRWVATFLAGGRNALATLGSQPAGRSRGKKS